jgi:hypothetical protein
MLKLRRDVSDGLRMFMPCSDAPAIAESAIAAFCASLNTPVLNIEMLEVGLARAGIMLAAQEYGQLVLLVRVSLMANGEGVTFQFQGDPADLGDAAGALEAALSFSEGMGFLFEEDLLCRGDRSGRARAFNIWNSLCNRREDPIGAAEPTVVPEAARVAAPPPVARGPVPAAEIELTDAMLACEPGGPVENETIAQVADSLTQSFLELGGEEYAGDAPPEVAMGSPVLTKFRERREPAGAVRRPGSEELGRVAIETEELATEFVDDSGFLTRLLSCY